MIIVGNREMKQLSFFFSLAESPDMKKEQDHPTKPHTKKHSKLAGFQLPPGPSFRTSGGLLEATSFKANTASSCCLHFFISNWVGCEKRGITCWPSNPLCGAFSK